MMQPNMFQIYWFLICLELEQSMCFMLAFILSLEVAEHLKFSICGFLYQFKSDTESFFDIKI